MVADTNVLVSAIIADGKPRLVLRMCARGELDLLLSPAILDEVAGVLHRPKFEVSKVEVHRILRALLQTGRVIETRSSFQVVDEDPDDDAILHAAVDGRADHLVTGDQHLLDLGSFRGVGIVTVARFLAGLDGR